MNYEKLIGIRNSLFLNDKYRLDLTWDKVLYEREGVCYLKGAKFSGPVISLAERIEPNNFILLDLYRQYYTKVNSVYICVLSWVDVIYNDTYISLTNCKLSHETELNNVTKFKNDDRIVIDTDGHEKEEHAHNMTYRAYVVNTDFQLYNFISG